MGDHVKTDDGRCVIIETECGMETGPFWGVDGSGWRPECLGHVEYEIEVQDLLEYGPGPDWDAPVIMECPKCGTTLDWPHNWWLKDGETLEASDDLLGEKQGEQQKTWRTTMNWKWIILVAIAVGAIALFFWFNNLKTPDTESEPIFSTTPHWEHPLPDGPWAGYWRAHKEKTALAAYFLKWDAINYLKLDRHQTKEEKRRISAAIAVFQLIGDQMSDSYDGAGLDTDTSEKLTSLNIRLGILYHSLQGSAFYSENDTEYRALWARITDLRALLQDCLNLYS